MNSILNHAYAPLLPAVLIRWLLARASGTAFLDLAHMHGFETWLWLAAAMGCAVSIWHRFVRLRCPGCKTPAPQLTKTEEIDRYVAPKKVYGKDGNGRTTTTYASTTFVKLRDHYYCTECQRKWTVLRTPQEIS